MRTLARAMPAALVVLTLTACGSSATAIPEPSPIAEATAIPETTATSDLASIPTSAATSDLVLDARADDVDITAELTEGREPWTEHVIIAMQTEPERVEIETSIVDPRGDNGSPEAQQAIEVCQGAVAWLEAQGVTEPKVSVFEADGTHFVTYGHPTLSVGACTEY